MAQFETWLEADLQKMIKPQMLTGAVFSADSMANLVGVKVYNGGAPATLGGSVSGKVIRADGSTVPVSGTLSGNAASIVLPQAAYAVVGPITISIAVTEGGATTTLACAVGVVTRTSTDTTVDPGTIIPSIDALIAQINAAINSIPADYSALLAAIAPTFSASAAYPAGAYVWQGGTLYRFTAAHAAGSWTGTDATAADLGGDVADLKRAYNHLDSRLFNGIDTILNIWEQGGLNYNSGIEQSSTTTCRTREYFTPLYDVLVSIENPDGLVLGTRKYNVETGEYEGSTSVEVLTYETFVILKAGYKYRLICSSTGDPTHVTAVFTYYSDTARKSVQNLDSIKTVSDEIRNNNLVNDALYSYKTNENLLMQRESLNGIKLIGTIPYRVLTWITMPKIDIVAGRTYTLYVRSKNGLSNNKINISLQGLDDTSQDFAKIKPLVFTAPESKTSRLRIWMYDDDYQSGYAIDDTWYIYLLEGTHDIREFEPDYIINSIPIKLDVCAWNIGNYNYGRPDDYPRQNDVIKVRLIKKFLTEHYPDIICCTEFYNLDMEGDDGIRDTATHFQPIYPYYYKTGQYMVASKYELLDITKGTFANQADTGAIKGWVKFSIIVGNTKITFMNIHAASLAENATIRQSEFEEIVNDIIKPDEKNVVILGDFNTQGISELDIFVNKGYTLVNGGYIGTFFTCPAIAPNKPYDNIIFKGDIKGVGYVWPPVCDPEHTDDEEYYISDHLPLFGKLVING